MGSGIGQDVLGNCLPSVREGRRWSGTAVGLPARRHPVHSPWRGASRAWAGMLTSSRAARRAAARVAFILLGGPAGLVCWR